MNNDSLRRSACLCSDHLIPRNFFRFVLATRGASAFLNGGILHPNRRASAAFSMNANSRKAENGLIDKLKFGSKFCNKFGGIHLLEDTRSQHRHCMVHYYHPSPSVGVSRYGVPQRLS
jgi:hypothetical protein